MKLLLKKETAVIYHLKKEIVIQKNLTKITWMYAIVLCKQRTYISSRKIV